jgi:transposase InsO family protein
MHYCGKRPCNNYYVACDLSVEEVRCKGEKKKMISSANIGEYRTKRTVRSNYNLIVDRICSKGIRLVGIPKKLGAEFYHPGQTGENAFAESFNGRLRDECLNIDMYLKLKRAMGVIEGWRRDYNEVRPHGSLKNITPMQYANAMIGL